MRWCRVVISCLACMVLLVAAGCGSTDTRTVITVWSWEPSMSTVARNFEKSNPDIRVVVKSTSGYENLNTAIQNGYGLPDVVQLEYYALPQYAVSGQLLDITSRVSGMKSFYTPGTWSSVTLNHEVYGLPMDSGPMAFFYNKSVFEQAGIDASAIKTWDEYYQAAKKLKSIGVYIAADAGDASFFNAMVWLSGGQPFHTSDDGKTVTVNLTSDAGTRTFAKFWQKMIDEGLVDTSVKTWSDDWKKALGDGTVASVFAGAWMPSLLLADVPGTAGLWRVTTMPTKDGSTANSENGGSALAVLRSTRKPDAAYRFVEYICHNRQGIATRVAGGAFPADTATLGSSAFLGKTTVTDSRGLEIPYFGGQEFNRVLSQAADDVSVRYQYLPFEVYARGDFRSTVGTAYQWSKAKIAFDEASSDSSDGSSSTASNPGKKVTLMDGVALWEKDLVEYGTNQGFTMR